ncbi:MAG: hypothetical protein RDV48_07415 [Candidatus Eremiobacteraeota bacterium]|nr:hypothetical protein [Candidatus Eremiobacteraeota bacterium]
MDVYERYAYRIKELKDLLLDFDIYGDDDLIEASMRHQDQIIREIRAIYQDKMIPLLEEMACYVSENIYLLGAASSASHDRPLPAGGSGDDGSRSRGQALDMGTSLLSSIIDNIVDSNG